MTNPNIAPIQGWDASFPRLAKLTGYLIGGLLTAESLILLGNVPESDPLTEQQAVIAVETSPVIAEIAAVPKIVRSTVVPPSTGILPPEITQPECVSSSITWLPETVSRWHPYVEQAAKMQEVPPQILDILMFFETLGNPEITSYQNAVGLIQLLPSTATGLFRQLGFPELDLKDPAVNVLVSAKLVRNILNSGKVDLSLGFNTEAAKRVAIAYHGGDGNLNYYLQNGLEALRAVSPKTTRYGERVAQAWGEKDLPTSQAYEDLMRTSGGQDAMRVASVIGTPPC
jgi:hypothetical protein